MSDTAPPPLPFFPDAENIEQAAQQLLDHGAKIEQIRGLQVMLAARQDAVHAQVVGLHRDFGRVMSNQTVIAGVLTVLVRRQRRQMVAAGVPIADPDDEKLEEALIGRLK